MSFALLSLHRNPQPSVRPMKMRGIVRALAALLAASAIASPASGASASKFIPVARNVRIHVVDAGAATAKPTLVLIPGWRLTTDIWSDEITTFAKSRRVIALDPRSQGQSTITPDGDTPEQRARDLHEVLRKLNAGPVVLVGWSQGVQDVAAYVGQFGNSGLKGIVLVDSTVSKGAANVAKDPAGAARQLQLVSLFVHNPTEGMPAMLSAIIRSKVGQARLANLVADGLKTPPAIGAAMLVDDLFGPDRTPALAKIEVPTLVIASAASGELEGQREMAGMIRNAEFHQIENAGHAVFVDQPARFNALMDEFLQKRVH